MESKKKYYSELNIFRGLIIVWVVIGHSFDADGSFFGMLNTYAYTFHMSSFFILSGILFAPKIKRIHSFKDGAFAIFERFKRLMIPYLFFTVVSYILKMFFSDYAYNEVSTGSELVLNTLIGVNNPNGGIWFLNNLFIFSVIAILLRFLPSAVTFVLSAALYTLSYFVEFNSNFGSLIAFSPFFFLGVFISRYYDKISAFFNDQLKKSSGRKKVFAFTALLAVLSAAVFAIYAKFSLAEILPAFKLIVCAINVICWYMISISLMSTEKIKKPANIIGNYGMDIYMIGYYVQISIRVVFGSMLGLPYLFYSICMFIFGLVLPIPISKYIVRKIKILRILVLGDFSKKK